MFNIQAWTFMCYILSTFQINLTPPARRLAVLFKYQVFYLSSCLEYITLEIYVSKYV